MKDSEIQELFSLRNEYRSLRYDLANIETLCSELGHPHRSFRSVLVAGTNGKGSVAQWLAGMVDGAGLYTSPHLEQLNERISIRGSRIDDSDLQIVADQVRAAAGRSRRRLLYPPTYFERVTAMAFCYFQSRVRHAVLEVGLGGRLDATNVVSQDVSVITNIGLDHQEHLGATTAEIAFEKAGIIKESEPVVVGPRCRYPAIRDRAGDRLIEAGPPGLRVREIGDGSFEFDLATPVRLYRGIRPSLAGRHQVENAVVAIRAGECLEAAGWPIDADSIVSSIQSSFWPGRLERVSGDLPLLLDGAHNPDAARALAGYLDDCHPEGVCLIFGAMSGKDCPGILLPLVPCATRVILTKPDNDRAIEPAELAPLVPGAEVTRSLAEALSLAERVRRRGETVLVAGSLFLVGEARSLVSSVSRPGQ
jgi:dihydrofolate synthase/folylpolyglutamate synthase